MLETFVGQMTVSEFCTRTGRGVDELLGFCLPNGAGQGTSGSSRSARPRSGSRVGGLDEQILGLLGRATEGMGGRELANATGATLPQVRGALKRLVAAKQARFAGKTAARRYWAK